MKRKSASQSAFFNPRLILAFVFCSGGIFLALFGFGLFPGGLAFAQGAKQTESVRGTAEMVPLSKPVSQDQDLRALPYIAPKAETEHRRLLRHPLPQTPSLKKSDPVLAVKQSAQAVAMPTPIASFDGINSVQSGCGCLPPDTDGDVGPNHYIASVNTSIKIFDKSGNPLNGVNGTTYNSFFSAMGSSTPCGGGLNDGDGFAFYDQLADRWVVSDFAFAANNQGNYQCIGVSKTGDPVSGGWWLYALQIDPSNPTWFGDYPKFGLWPDAYYLSVNLFIQGGAGTFEGVRVFALPRAAMINGTGAPNPGAVGFTITPATLGDAYSLVPATFRTGTAPPAGAAEYFMAINSSATAGTLETQVFTWRFHVDFVTPANSTFGSGANHSPNGTTTVNGFVDAFTSTSTLIVPQTGTTATLDTLGDKIMTPLVYQNLSGTESLWASHTVNNNQGGTGPTAIRWYQFNVTGGTIPATPAQQQTFNNGADGLWRFMPSIAVDASGSMAINYSVSSGSTNPAIKYAGRLVNDPSNSLAQGEALLIQGAGHQTDTSGRWGDYSALSIDPSDNATFWLTNEYYAATSGTGWNTRIGNFKMAPAVPTPQPVADTANVTADSCNSNGVIDPNEMVTVSFGIKNVGTLNTSNLVATLQATGGVTSPSGPQTYGALVAGGATVFRSFSFTAGSLACGSTLTATLQLQDGATNFGTITYTFTMGVSGTILSESFDGVVAPALPAGWVATNASGVAPLWVTSTTTPDSAPNDAFIDDPATVSDKRLDTPAIAITSASAQVSFHHSYDLESSGGNFYDGAVLEVSSPNINAGAFTDITNAAVGGSFVSGGYSGTISSSFGNPLAGRQAWSGNSGGYITTVANLGPNVTGQTIKLRFRMGSDSSNSATGWRVDTIRVSGFVCCGAVGTPIIGAGGAATLTAENFTPANGAPDPGETVKVDLPLINTGTGNTTNLVGTLQATGGVTSPSGPQTYGVVIAGGAAVSKSFSFIASGSCGSNITLTLALQDGATNLGMVTYTLRLGTVSSGVLFSEAFDGVSAPSLPAGWTTAATGGESAWVTSTTNSNSAPNDAFAPDATNVGNTELVTPTIAVPAGGGQLTFKNLYNMESTFDGMVLEISVNGGAFSDITTGGNAFLAGGYNATISSSFSSPIAGRSAWSGLSGGTTTTPAYITSTINLPAGAAGQNIKLKWRAASDSSVVASGAAGVRIDGISITASSNVCVSTQAPSITNGPPPSPVIVGTPYSFAFTGTGNPPPTYSFMGTLPPGLGLSAAGVLSGTATSGGTGSFPGIMVTATNGVPPDAAQTFTLTTATLAANYIASFGLTGSNAVLTFDYDGDGIANLMEYGLGLDPTIAELKGLPIVTLKDYSGTKYLSMLFNRSSLATDLTYIVQASSDLTTWTNLGTSSAGGMTSGAGFVTETGSAPSFTVEVRDTVPYDGNPLTKRFMRLKITSP
jgi:hypothetical protein